MINKRRNKRNIIVLCRRIFKKIKRFLGQEVYFGRHSGRFLKNAIVFFPCRPTLLCCGITAIVAVKKSTSGKDDVHTGRLGELIQGIDEKGFNYCTAEGIPFEQNYLGGKDVISSVSESVHALKKDEVFTKVFQDRNLRETLQDLSDRINKVIDREYKLLSKNMGLLETGDFNVISERIEFLKDIGWCLVAEVLDNIKKVSELIGEFKQNESETPVGVFKRINAVFNSIDRLEVRGRDSAGISLMFILEKDEYNKFSSKIEKEGLDEILKSRTKGDVLLNGNISINKIKDESGKDISSLAFTYKVASEIGSLGDNVKNLRSQVKNDGIFQILAMFPVLYFTVSAHTRWASVGEISEPNCHPLDNRKITGANNAGTIHVCLNGDIDNYLKIKEALESSGRIIDDRISTDTKVIPLQIEKYIFEGHSVEDSFRLAVNDFEGSHAISMHTDLAPGKLFVAQRGSGQALFVGMAEDNYMAASEVYGFVEETSDFLKLEGEKIVKGKNGEIQGQMCVIDQMSGGKLDGIKCVYYDGSPVELKEDDIKHTEITSRDIDRQGFPHYFLKETTEAPVSVEKTLQNRWKIEKNTGQHVITLDEKVVPKEIRDALSQNKIKRVFYVGQGTAGVAARACADILNYYMNDSSMNITALKASEMSGFRLGEFTGSDSMADTLMIAISQSGTTADTNRTVDMVRERGGMTLAIVNRRDSDITFKVNGVLYTSSGRDIEMSVASTKAFYSQIVAGAILGLFISFLKKRRGAEFVSGEIKELLRLPDHMRAILSMHRKIEASAGRLAVTRTYWAVVGSGPNKASADEIRIKLSELCYKTISSDYVEDKKHIDLSSEPLIIVCAAGTRGSVIGDIVKDTAIFKAHKALPVVIADEGEERFTPYAEDIFYVPITKAHFAPILNTLVGHVWGYYAALAINDGSGFLYNEREKIRNVVDDFSEQGLDIYEVILEKSFRKVIADFYTAFRSKKAEKKFPEIVGIYAASDLTLLLKYLLGKLPLSDFELDFNRKGTAFNMLKTLFERLGEMINCMSRPVDAIKHQAKTVTVGTSRVSERVEGILFDSMASFDINISQLTNSNIIVLKNLQRIVSEIQGAIFYKIEGLDVFGELDEETTIEVIEKEGILKGIPSRVEKDTKLKGTKRIIVRQGNVYIGKGRKDNRSILIIPVISSSTPNLIGNLLLLTISFKEKIDFEAKKKALGGKFEHIKNIVQENNIQWEDALLELVEISELFGRSAEKVGEYIVSKKHENGK